MKSVSLVTNRDETKKSSGKNFKIYDLNGNEYQASNIKIGIEDWSKGYGYEEMYILSKDIPIKCTVLFTNVQEKILFIKSLSFDITADKTRKEKRVDLKDFKVEWK